MVGQYSIRTMESSPMGDSSKQSSDVSYQIDCQTTKKGKLIAGTKRRICWKFGFSNPAAMQRGLTGTDCRGEEHQVVFVWSWTSGKKFVLADGHEVHWSKHNPLAETFEGPWQCSWQSQMGGAKRKFEVVAYSRKSKSNTSVADGSFRNFDLIIDGVPFSKMPQMFELGLTKKGLAQQQQQQPQQQRNYQMQQQTPVRRKQLYKNDLDTMSYHSSSSQHQRSYSPPDLDTLSLHSFSSQHQRSFTPRDMSRNSFSANDLRHSTSFYTSTSQQFQSPYHTSQNSFAANDLLDFQEQSQRHRSTPVALHSQSMPDMQYGFSQSPTSVMVAGQSSPNFHYQHQQQNQPSPTSVTASNPFDIYISATKPLQQPQQPQQRSMPTQNNNYTPYRQQQRHSSVF